MIAEAPLLGPRPGDEDEPRPIRWHRDDYHRMAELGLFGDRRVELVEGTVIAMSAMKRPHWMTGQLASDLLRAAFGPGFFVTMNMPSYLDEYSEPEPDVAVVAGSPRDYPEGAPTTPVLVVEVAESSLEYDRSSKASLYAKAGIPEYWIVNLRERQVEVYQHPGPDETQPSGFGYASRTDVPADGSLSPPGVSAQFAVADILS